MTSLKVGFYIDEKEQANLLLIEKIPQKSGTVSPDIRTRYDHFSLLMNELIGEEGISTNGAYIKNVYENSVLNALIKKWIDTKRNIFSYLVVTSNSFIPRLANDEILGHISLREWEKYVANAKLIFMEEQKKRRTNKKSKQENQRVNFNSYVVSAKSRGGKKWVQIF